nr:VTT domain-containing protein [uncultured Microbacterium sp.]
MDVINELIVQVVASPWLYVTLFVVTVIDGFFPPVPSETVLVAAAAVMASHHDVWAWATLGLVAAMGASVGDNIAFAIGRRVGTTRFSWMRRPVVTAALAHAESALEQRSAALILGARWIPVGRVAMNMSAGAVGFAWRRFLPLSIVAGISWSVVSLAIGLLAGSWVADQPLVGAGIGIAVALVLGLVIDLVTRRRRLRQASTHGPGVTTSPVSVVSAA